MSEEMEPKSETYMRHEQNCKTILAFIDKVKMHRGPIDEHSTVLAALAEIVLEDE